MLAKSLTLKNGIKIPRLGQGTWFMGENKSKRSIEIETLRRGVELGMTLIDSAEMYGDGASERLVGEAIQGLEREKLFLVSKVYPHNAGKGKLQNSLENTLKRMKTDYLDMYLLHWRGSIPLEETVECMEEQVKTGKIRSWGVSNLDIDDMEELWSVAKGSHCMVDQVLYHIGSRGVEFSLIPWLNQHKTPLMAYCPLAQGGSLKRDIFNNQIVQNIAKIHRATPAQIVLNFILQENNVFAIPKASSIKHVEDNAKALELELTNEELKSLDVIFPAPKCKTYLDIV